MDYYNSCERCVSYCFTCKDCAKEYESWGIVLETKEEELKWMDGKLKYPE